MKKNNGRGAIPKGVIVGWSEARAASQARDPGRDDRREREVGRLGGRRLGANSGHASVHWHGKSGE